MIDLCFVGGSRGESGRRVCVGEGVRVLDGMEVSGRSWAVTSELEISDGVQMSKMWMTDVE